MKVRNWKSKVVCAIALAAGMGVSGEIQADELNINLIVDPGFEDVNATTGAYNARQLNSWRDGSKIGFTYASGQYDNGGPLAGGGARYFTANQTSSGDAEGPGEISQLLANVGTGATGAAISAGLAQYTFGAFFSTYVSDNDFGVFHVDFRDAANVSLGTNQIVAPPSLQNWTELSLSGMVPVGTTNILLSVYGDGTSSGHDGYIDNTSFVISAIPEPTSAFILTAGLFGATLIRRRRD